MFVVVQYVISTIFDKRLDRISSIRHDNLSQLMRAKG
jgi:hypothetical protein